MARLLIDNDQIAAEYFADARLVGLQCSLEPHQLAWYINRQFMFDFRYQCGSEILVTKKGRSLRYPVFLYREPHLQLTHYIYANQCDGEYLMVQLRHFDFLWLLKGDQHEDASVGILLNELKRLEQVQVVTELASDKIKDKTQLVL